MSKGERREERGERGGRGRNGRRGKERKKVERQWDPLSLGKFVHLVGGCANHELFFPKYIFFHFPTFWVLIFNFFLNNCMPI